MTIVAHLTDLHIREGGALAYGRVDTRRFLATAVDHLNAVVPRPDAVVVSGDLVDLGTALEYAIARTELDRLEIPWYPIPGNHDGDAFWDVMADRMDRPERGVGHVADAGAICLILLDTSVPGAFGGRVDSLRAEWLAAELRAAGRPSLLVMHHPPMVTGIGHMDAIGLDGVDRVAAVIAGAPPLAILSGHVHRTIVGRLGAVPVLVAPSPAHSVTLDLTPDAPSTFHMEPPGVLLHRFEAGALVSHLLFVGTYPGPFPFFSDGRLVGT